MIHLFLLHMESKVKIRIQGELEKLKNEEVALENDYAYKWHSGMATFNILQNLERIRKRYIELEAALEVIEEFK